MSLSFEDLGLREVKNIDRPLRAWQWHPDWDPAGGAEALSRSASASARPAVHRGPAIPATAIRSSGKERNRMDRIRLERLA